MKALKNGQVKIGAVFSYLLIIFNSLYAVFLTPFIIGQVGTESYGVYKTISSLAATMMVMDFGIGGTVQRYIAKYRASNEDEKIPGFLAMAIIISIGLNLLLALVAVIMFFCITPMYGGSFTAEQLALARQLFILLSINSLIVVFENVFNGIIAGCNHFIFGNGLRLFLLLIRVISSATRYLYCQM